MIIVIEASIDAVYGEKKSRHKYSLFLSICVYIAILVSLTHSLTNYEDYLPYIIARTWFDLFYAKAAEKEWWYLGTNSETDEFNTKHFTPKILLITRIIITLILLILIIYEKFN